MNEKELKEIIKNGGCTLNKKGQAFTSNKGFMISIFGKEVKTTDEEMALDKINEYIRIIQNKKGLYVGVWIDKGSIYVDLSIHIINKVEALEFGKKNKQLAIYDLKNNKNLYLKDYKFNKYYTIYKVVRDNENKITDYKCITQLDKISELVSYFECSIKTIKNSIYNNLKNDYKQLINDCIIIKDYELKL